MTPRTFRFEAIGTHWTIDIDQEITDAQFEKVKRAIRKRIEIYDKTYSRFRSDSLVTSISREAGSYTFPADAGILFSFYEQIYKVTDGKVTPLIGNLMADAGYNANYSFKPKSHLKPALKWESTISYKHPTLTVNEPVLLDIGAAGKGYLVDIVGELLKAHAINSFCIDAGGDLLHSANNDDVLRVGLEHPSDPEQAIGIALLRNGSICGSASNRRKWAGLHHIMDPDNTRPVSDIIATWVMADSALVADGLATALFFTDPTVLQDVWDFEYCIVRDDFSFATSPHLQAELFTGVAS